MLKHTSSLTQGYFLCYYIPSKKDATVLSDLLINFKNNAPTNIVNELCEWACTELLQAGIKIDLIVRALGSKETEPLEGKALDQLGNKLAEYLNACYKPELLKKRRFTYPMKRLELEERKAAINNAYYFDGKDISGTNTILIIDDIYTSGATINEIIRSVKVEYPKLSICFFTLGKTDFQSDKNKEIVMPYYIAERNIDKLEEAKAEYVYL